MRLKLNRVFIAHSVVFLAFLINAFRPGTVPSIVIFALTMVAPFFLSPTEIAAYIVGFAMLGTGIQIAYTAMACLVALLVKSKMKLPLIVLASILVFAVYELIHLLFAPSDTFMDFLRYACIYGTLFFSLFLDYDVTGKLRVINSYIYGTMFCVVHVFIESLLYFNGNLTRFFDGNFRFGFSSQTGMQLTMSSDPNLVGQSCSLVIAFCLALILLGYIQKKYFFALGIAVLAGTLTLSKTFLLSLAFIVAFVILFMGKWTSAKMFSRRILMIALIAVGCIMIAKIYPSYIQNIFARVDSADVTSGRVDIFIEYSRYLLNNIIPLLFGIGMQNAGTKTGVMMSPHSAIIEALICWGIVGTIVLFVVFVLAFRKQLSAIKPKVMNFFPLLLFVILIQSTPFFRLRDRVFALITVLVFSAIPPKASDKQMDKE